MRIDPEFMHGMDNAYNVVGEHLAQRLVHLAHVATGEERVPTLDAIEVTATPYLANRRGQQDVGGCYPAAKAAIDGLADAGVIPGDGPDHVRSLTFTAPVFGQGDALVLLVTEAR